MSLIGLLVHIKYDILMLTFVFCKTRLFSLYSSIRLDDHNLKRQVYIILYTFNLDATLRIMTSSGVCPLVDKQGTVIRRHQTEVAPVRDATEVAGKGTGNGRLSVPHTVIFI